MTHDGQEGMTAHKAWGAVDWWWAAGFPARRRAGPLAVVLVLLSLAGCTREPTERERVGVLTWLTCVECGAAELSFVVDSLGPAIAPLLEHALAGTDTTWRDNLAWQFGRAYDRGQFNALSRDDYVARFIANYEAMVQRRAAAALGALGQRDALERALADSAQRGYRSDVIASIRVALGATATQQQGVVASVEIVPGDVVIRQGQTTNLEAVVHDASGAEIAAAVTWASGNTAVATVTPQTGQVATVAGVAAGATPIIASVTTTGEEASATVTVLDAVPANLRIAYRSGSPQAGPVNTVLALPLVVLVTNSAGTEQPNVQVDWVFPDGGGTFTTTNTSTATTLTNASGEASIQVRLGPTPRPQIAVNASIGGDPVRFRLRAN